MSHAVRSAALVLCLATAAVAGERPKPMVSLVGDVVCAKCTLHVPGQEQCQNVLLVGRGESRAQYWIVDNAVARAFGAVCTAEKPVTVTGTVEQKDGKQWLAPDRIVPGGDQ